MNKQKIILKNEDLYCYIKNSSVSKKGSFVLILALVFLFLYTFIEKISIYTFSIGADILNTVFIILSLPVITFILAKLSFIPQAILISGNSSLESLINSWRRNKTNNRVFWISWIYIFALIFPIDLFWRASDAQRMNGLIIGILFLPACLSYFYLETPLEKKE